MCYPAMAAPKNSTCKEARPVNSKKSSRARGSRKVGPNENFSSDAVHTLSCEKTFDHACVQRPPISTASDIRSRFLNRLGIQKVAPSSAPQEKLASHRNPKDTADDPSTTSTARTSRCSSFSSLSSNKASRSVSFDDSVTVRPIPRHDAYSSEEKHLLWADPYEIYENATRNSIEFAADNFDWQQASEEEDFVETETGDLVHPIHYVRRCDAQRNFLLVMAARQQQCR